MSLLLRDPVQLVFVRALVALWPSSYDLLGRLQPLVLMKTVLILSYEKVMLFLKLNCRFPTLSKNLKLICQL